MPTGSVLSAVTDDVIAVFRHLYTTASLHITVALMKLWASVYFDEAFSGGHFRVRINEFSRM
jgi:hypothetical protein